MMDILSLLRTLGALGIVLGMLAGALWAVRRYDVRLPGRIATGSDRRLHLVERLAIDSRRAVALISRDGHEHLILIAPEGHLVIEQGIAPARRRQPASKPRVNAQARMAADAPRFADLIERTGRAAQATLQRGRSSLARVRRPDPVRGVDAARGEGDVHA